VDRYIRTSQQEYLPSRRRWGECSRRLAISTLPQGRRHRPRKHREKKDGVQTPFQLGGDRSRGLRNYTLQSPGRAGMKGDSEARGWEKGILPGQATGSSSPVLILRDLLYRHEKIIFRS